MCGIVGVIKRKEDDVPTNKSIMEMFDKQKHRGVQGLGYVSFNDNLTMYCRRQSVKEIEKAIEKNDSRSIVFHHRYPTSTPNYSDCTHPIRVSHKELRYDYYFVHNGVISNDTVLYEAHKELGYEYTTKVVNKVITQNHVSEDYVFNDSEALAIDVVRYIEGKQTEIKANGSIAFICIQVKKKNSKIMRVFFGRNSSPLEISFTNNELVLRSEGGEEDILPNIMYCLEMNTWKITEENVKIGGLISSRFNDWDSYGRNATKDDEDEIDKFLGKRYDNSADYENDDRQYGKVVVTDEELADLGVRTPTGYSAEDGLPPLNQYELAEIGKLNVLIDNAEDMIAVFREDIETYLAQGDMDSVIRVEGEIKKIEDKIEVWEDDKESIIEGTYAD